MRWSGLIVGGCSTLAVAVVLLCGAPAAALTKTCLTGTDPSVADDADQIHVVRAEVDAACPCASFDGSAGKTHANYVKCATSVIKASTSLRPQCRGTVGKYYKNSVCGWSAAQARAPCVKTSPKGKVTCAITPAAKCVGSGKVACPGVATCVDAADSNHDLLIAAPGDTGACADRILSAFFGLDNALPPTVGLICPGAVGEDGMPLTFSRRVAVVTPAASAFRVTTQSGATHYPRCATELPAVNPSERHTVLLFGDLGDDPGDPPLVVDVVDHVPLVGGGDALGLSSTVTPLVAGPSLVLAIRYMPADLPASSCPSGATRQIIQTTWTGGVTAVGGGEFGDAERMRMHVTLENDAGGTYEVTPFALADLGDHDNYVHLCLDDGATPLSVRVETGTCVDPRGDPNGETMVAVTPDI